MLKVFIENEANSKIKTIFDEKNFIQLDTMEVSRAYPFPYGFIVNTTSYDGDNVDCFVLTKRELKKGEFVECEVIGLMEQFEFSWDHDKSETLEIDHNVIVKLKDEEIEFVDSHKSILKDFVLNVFNNVRRNKTKVGDFLPKEEALKYIEKNKDK